MTSVPRTFGRLARRRTQPCTRQPWCRSFSATTPARDEDIAIVGGGITGLGAAYFASKKFPHSKITVYEQSKRFGGWLQSSQHQLPDDQGSVLFEAGPRTLRPVGNGRLTLSMIEDLGLKDDLIVLHKESLMASNRYIYYPDHLVQIPAPPRAGWFSDFAHTVWTEEAFQGFLTALATEWMKAPRSPSVEDESVGSFLSRRLGKNTVDRIVSAVFHGIYAGDVYQLSARSLLKNAFKNELLHGGITKAALSAMVKTPIRPLTALELQFETYLQHLGLSGFITDTMKGASIFTFRQGVGSLTDSIIEYLKQHPNVSFTPGTTITSMTRTGDSVQVITKGNGDTKTAQHKRIIYTGTPQTLKGLRSTATKAELPVISSETVMTVNLYYKTPNMHPAGFGYLIPLGIPYEQNPENALGVVFDTSYSPDPKEPALGLHGPAQDFVSERGTKLTVMLGGHYWTNWTSYPTEEEGLQMAKEIVKRHLKISQEPLAWAVNLQKDCIPQYTVGHHKRIAKVHDWLMDKYTGRVKVAGSWIDGVGVNDCLRSAWDAVHSLDDYASTNLNHVVYETQE